MKQMTLRLLHLQHCRHMSNQKLLKFIQHKQALIHLYNFSPLDIANIISSDVSKATQLHYDLHHVPISSIIQSYMSKQIHIVSMFEESYPSILKKIYNPPVILYAMGNINLLNNHALSIVGTRKANHYAKAALQCILPPLLNKYVIVSGFARGVDTVSHETTIRLGGKTIAVLGSGFSHIYPQENVPLAENMKKNHLLLTEYAPHIRPQKWHFPMRNRIISGLSLGTLVVQAEKRSGSLITAEFALQENREVFAVPGRIDDPLSQGTNLLIQQGAKSILHGEDITNELIHMI